MSTSPVVAVLGLGTMGAPIARSLAAAGLTVRVWNRSAERAEPLADVATVARSAADAVSGADLVVTMLYDLDAVVATMTDARAALAPGAVWVQMSTVGVAGSERLAALAAELGVTYVDAPVLGTKKPAEDGTLVVLASGPADVRDRVDPVFEAVGSRTVWVGEAGTGSRLKLAANAWVMTVLEGVAESLALTRELGLDPALFLEAVAGGALDAPYVQVKGSAMLSGSFDPAFTLAGLLKDAELILEAARDAGVDLGLVPSVRDHLARGVDAGHGELDMAATYLTH